jgi:tetratricopeptide (TPR) repeat protein
LDDVKNPQFIETLPRRGYRFIARVKVSNGVPVGQESEVGRTSVERPHSVRLVFYTAFILLVIILGTALVWNFVSSDRSGGLASPNPEAQDAYLKGKHMFENGDPDSIKSSIRFFDTAIHGDEKFAAAYAARADAFYQLGYHGTINTKEVFPKAKADAIRAIELNQGLADVHAVLGSVAFRYDWSFPQAENHFKKAIAIDPNSANAFHDYAWFLASQERFQEAISSIEKAQQIEPTSIRTNIDVGWIYARARRYDEAISQMKRTLDLEPNNIAARQCLECAYYNKNMFAESVENAIGLMRRFGASDGDLTKIKAVEPRQAVRLIEEWRLKRMESTTDQYLPSYWLAIQAAAVDDKEKAFQYLEKAFQEKDAGLVMLKVEQVWDKFRTDPRYEEMLTRLGMQ